MLHYTKNEPFKQPAYYVAVMDNGAVLGSLEQEVDGFYYFTPSKIWANGGVIPSWVLMDLGRKLDALNEAWNQHLSTMFSILNGTTDHTE